jgi:hypothetical protein
MIERNPNPDGSSNTHNDGYSPDLEVVLSEAQSVGLQEAGMRVVLDPPGSDVPGELPIPGA